MQKVNKKSMLLYPRGGLHGLPDACQSMRAYVIRIANSGIKSSENHFFLQNFCLLMKKSFTLQKYN